MKKYLLGFLAVAFAVSFSAFRDVKPKEKFSNKYFRINNHNYTATQAVLSVDATYLGDTDPGASGCSGTSFQCISVFDATQVNGSNQLKDNNQVPTATPYKHS